MSVFKTAAAKIYIDARNEGRLIEGCSVEDLKQLALRHEGVLQTQMGSLAADSEPMSRSAPHTRNNIDHQFGEPEERLAQNALELLGRENLYHSTLWSVMGGTGLQHAFSSLFNMLTSLTDSSSSSIGPSPRVVENPTYTVVYFTDESFESNKSRKLVDKDITVRLWMGENRGEQVKICRNSIYLGEGKKGIFQFENWRVKAIDKTGIFLHAGARKTFLDLRS